MAERNRINWKSRHDALSVQHDQTAKELELVNGLLEVERKRVAELEGELAESRRAVDRAKLEGAKAVTLALLDA